ncbi:synaptotagmin-like protein 1 isoform X2 [Neoarius graeffei]|uniref:synaptotagmin-like protein 1 isoform X2 n=1 Tax=Neoarius graeffei TaxID=443677 RepID=UPI00298C74E6|nr:synaptotagmin-like protein 1 isoform X2 [Neoarius graeffei]
MTASRDATIFIDLSFLSPEEEEVIHKVLLRDEDLKKHEIGRVRKLRESIPDPKQLKVLSGEWFEDLKSKRYGRQPHISAVVRSSMRWKKSAGHKPNPFLKAVPEDKNGEKNKTSSDVSADPRSIHPALSVQVQQENKDEAVILEGVKNETPAPEALIEVAIPGIDTWEDEGVDSNEDSSSVSSHDSDLSGKMGQLSASTLSVTERTASLLSVYSDAGDFGNVAVQGSVEFAIMYSPLGELVIMVEQCQDLAIANPRKQRTDPYVKTYLYPDKRSKRKTSIKKHTVNPVYVESLRYKVKREELHGKTLNLSVWHNDSLGRNAFLGQVEINLKDWDWKHEALTWYNLQPKNADNQESQEYRGVLSVSLKYVPPEAIGGSRLSRPMGEIHIWLREARHLRRLRAQGVDSFVKCYMLPDTSKKSRQKTRMVKKTQDPVYNHTMVYDGFRVGEVCEACCELTVWDSNKLSNQFLGGVRLGLGTGLSYGKKVDWMDSENEEVEVWKKMMANPNSWVEAQLPLRSSMTPRQ